MPDWQDTQWEVSKLLGFDLSRLPLVRAQMVCFGDTIRRDARVSHNFSPLSEVHVANAKLGRQATPWAPNNCVD
jgi:hypothetical protein